MIYCYDSKRIKSCENDAIRSGDSAHEMILRASKAIYSYICANISFQKALIIAGYGNNGADGLALAALLKNDNQNVDVYCVPSSARSEENEFFYRSASVLRNFPDLSGYDLIVDCIFGYGFHGALSEDVQKITNAVNDSDAKVLSVDIPSGVESDTGRVSPGAIQADVTLALSCSKPAYYLYPATEFCGVVSLLNTDIPVFGEEKYRIITSLNGLLPKRTARSNKGTYGSVGILAGSKNMAGAAYFAAKAAYLTGAGMVKIFTPEENRIILQTLLPEAVLYTYNDATDEEEIANALLRHDALVIGPGIGTAQKSVQIVQALLKKISVPTVMDADALNIISKEHLTDCIPSPCVITPHPGEASRLLEIPVEQILSDPSGTASRLAEKCHCVALLKDAHTVITDGKNGYINLTGNDGMATAGSGDILAGIIGCLLANNEAPITASAVAAYIHGLSGELASKKYGKRSVTASHILDHISEVLKDF